MNIYIKVTGEERNKNKKVTICTERNYHGQPKKKKKSPFFWEKQQALTCPGLAFVLRSFLGANQKKIYIYISVTSYSINRSPVQ